MSFCFTNTYVCNRKQSNLATIFKVADLLGVSPKRYSVMMYNNLIDNSSEALSMQAYLKRCIQEEGINKIRIATGYWDIPGMALVIDELSRFLDREGTSCELLIGKDPYVYTSLLAKPKI